MEFDLGVKMIALMLIGAGILLMFNRREPFVDYSQVYLKLQFTVTKNTTLANGQARDDSGKNNRFALTLPRLDTTGLSTVPFLNWIRDSLNDKIPVSLRITDSTLLRTIPVINISYGTTSFTLLGLLATSTDLFRVGDTITIETRAPATKSYTEFDGTYYDACVVRSSDKTNYSSLQQAKTACDRDVRCNKIQFNSERPGYFNICNDGLPIDQNRVRCGDPSKPSATRPKFYVEGSITKKCIVPPPAVAPPAPAPVRLTPAPAAAKLFGPKDFAALWQVFNRFHNPVLDVVP